MATNGSEVIYRKYTNLSETGNSQARKHQVETHEFVSQCQQKKFPHEIIVNIDLYDNVALELAHLKCEGLIFNFMSYVQLWQIYPELE